jgi:hypothetical protein
LWKLEYCNDTDLSKSKPTKTTIKEVPFLKNNPHLLKVEEESKEGNNDGKYMTEKQKKIAELRK